MRITLIVGIFNDLALADEFPYLVVFDAPSQPRQCCRAREGGITISGMVYSYHPVNVT